MLRTVNYIDLLQIDATSVSFNSQMPTFILIDFRSSINLNLENMDAMKTIFQNKNHNMSRNENLNLSINCL